MGLFSSFRKNSSSFSSSREQEDVVHEREVKQLLKERKKQQKAILKQRKKEQEAINKQMKKQQDAQKKEQQQLEKEQKKVVQERKRAEKRIKQAEKERKRAIKKELNSVKALAKQTRKESKKKEREVKKQMYRLQDAQKKQERARKRVLKKQLKEEKKRQRYANEQEHLEYELEHHRMELAQSTVVIPTVNEIMPKSPPVFKNRLNCASCYQKFIKFPTRSRHHCRQCGDSFCSHCLSTSRRVMPWIQLNTPQRICVSCDELILEQGQKEKEIIPQRSLSLSEQPVSEEETNSPTSSSRGIRLRSRSRSGTSKNGKKNSIWNLPIRPLLKRKESIDQLRNRTWDLNLQVEKAQQFAKMNNHARVLGMTSTTLQPIIATAS